MTVGIIGAGNMGRALALGLGEPIVCADPVAERAAALAGETGGEALASNREVAERADVVVLCHKPAQLEQVAADIAGNAKAVLSILGGRSLADLEAALPETPVSRAMPNVAVELGRGVVCYARGARVDDELDGRLRELLGRLGVVLDVPDGLLDPATGVTGVAPAYMAVIVEAWIDSAVHHGIPRRPGEPDGHRVGRRGPRSAPGPRRGDPGNPPRGHLARRRHRGGARRARARGRSRGLRRCDGRRDGALPGMSALVIATTRGTIADYVYALFLVYSVIIVIYVLSSLIFSLGVRVPYSRWSDAVLGFLRDVCEPYLRIFRRFIPMIGPLDISPIVALIVLSLVGSVVEGLIRG